jgi:hypothetical protein
MHGASTESLDHFQRDTSNVVSITGHCQHQKNGAP